MTSNNKILLVDDHVGDSIWLTDYVESRGYTIRQVTNEEAARSELQEIKRGRKSYILAIVDIMISTRDIMELVDLDEDYFDESMDTGIRLCEYAREELKIDPKELPIVCITARTDQNLVAQRLQPFGVELYERTSQDSAGSIRDYLEKQLPAIS